MPKQYNTANKQNNDNYKKLYSFLMQFNRENGYNPSVREICNHMGFTSTCTAFYYLKKLQELGKIEKSTTQNSRAFKIIYDEPKKSVSTAQPINFNRIPLVGTIAAGAPILATENIEEFYNLPTNLFKGSNLFMLEVQGNSMIDIGMNNGDMIIVKKQETANNGEIVAALVDDSATVKRFYQEKDCIRLQPENKAMQPIFLKEVQILGKVIGLIRQF